MAVPSLSSTGSSTQERLFTEIPPDRELIPDVHNKLGRNNEQDSGWLTSQSQSPYRYTLGLQAWVTSNSDRAPTGTKHLDPPESALLFQL